MFCVLKRKSEHRECMYVCYSEVNTVIMELDKTKVVKALFATQAEM